MGPQEDSRGDRAADDERHDHPRNRRPRAAAGGRAALGTEARALGIASLARGDSRVSDAARDGHAVAVRRRSDLALQWCDRGPRRRAGRGRRPAGRRPARPAPADSLDRRDRAAAAGLADVRRRHRRAAARAAPARDRARAPALRPRRAGRRPRAAARAAGVLSSASSFRPGSSPSRAPASVCRPAASPAPGSP